jgi:hypothetical protein
MEGQANGCEDLCPHRATLWSVPDEPYRAPLPVPPDPYAAAWAAIRRRQRVAWAGGPIGVFLGIASVHWLGNAAPLVGLPLTAVILIASGLAAEVRCPHCGGSFFTRRRGYPVLSATQRNCASCGIERGTPKSAVVEAEKRAADVTGAGV